MKIIRFLLKPVMYLAFLCAVAAIIYFRSVIFHQNVNQYIDLADAYVEKQLDVVLPAYAVEIKEVEIKNEASVENDAVDISNTDEAADISASSESISEVSNDMPIVIDRAEAPVVDENDNKQSSEIIVEAKDVIAAPLQPDESAGLIKQLNETVDSLTKKVESLIEEINATKQASLLVKKIEQVAVPVTKVKQPVVEQAAVINHADNEQSVSSDADVVMASDADAVLLKARQMFWNGNPQGSEALYLDLVALRSDDPDVYGELGNVYYAQGKWNQAGKAYYEAAIRLFEMKRNDQVNYLLRVIQGLDVESANKLRNVMQLSKT